MSFDLKKYYRHISSQDIDETKLSILSKVDYVPLYAVHYYHDTDSNINSDLNSDEDFIYPKFKHIASSRISRYADLFSQLNGNRMIKSVAYSFKSNDIDQTVFVSNGIIADEYGNILLLLTAKKEYFSMLCEIYNNGDEELDYSNLVLFVADEFFKNPIYNHLWKKIEKEFYYDAISKGVKIEVNTIDEITNKCFNDGINVDFNNIEEFHNYLNNDIYNNIVQVNQRIAEEEEARRLAEEEAMRQRRREREEERERKRERKRQEEVRIHQEQNALRESLPDQNHRQMYEFSLRNNVDATYDDILNFFERLNALPNFKGLLRDGDTENAVIEASFLAVFIGHNVGDPFEYLKLESKHIHMSVEELIQSGICTMDDLVEAQPNFVFVDENEEVEPFLEVNEEESVNEEEPTDLPF